MQVERRDFIRLGAATLAGLWGLAPLRLLAGQGLTAPASRPLGPPPSKAGPFLPLGPAPWAG